MTYLFFISITGLIGIIGAALFSFRAKWPLGRILLPLLSVFFCAAGLLEYYASFDTNLLAKEWLTRSAVVLHFLIAVSLLELTVSLLGKEGIRSPFQIRSKRLPLRLFWRPLALIAIESIIFLPWFDFLSDQGNTIVQCNRVGEVLFSLLFVYHLLILYVVEKIFRTISTIQKRIFALYLISIGLIALGSMIMLARILFFKIIAFDFIQLHAVICGIFFPGMLIGLTRYRLWQEQIAIGRGIVYTSITILFFGLFLISLGVVASAVRLLGIHFTQFEGFVILFALLFLGILLIFSPNMRATITDLSRKYIYKSKYDYRDQLFRLHGIHQTAGNVDRTIIALVDNLRYTIVVKNAFVFLRSFNENHFTCTDPARIGVLRANAPLVRLFNDNIISAIDTAYPGPEEVVRAMEAERPLLDTFKISHLFSIRHEGVLKGILAIEAGKRVFDSEDLMLVTILCESIGTAMYRDRIERDRIEQKQFESFSHMASFIVHDIKNQVATLSLVTKNARENIGNTAFHPVLLRSLENCSENLAILIEKLKSPPQKEQLLKTAIDGNTIVENLVVQTRPALPQGITIRSNYAELPLVSIDGSALSYVIKNLLINAIEALGREGTISCSTIALSNRLHDDTATFGFTPFDLDNHTIAIIVEDNGPGMSRSFIEERLFKPFNTTKDKGIGIGLYQCKTLVESMGGCLLCKSEEGRGARFCILL